MTPKLTRALLFICLASLTAACATGSSVSGDQSQGPDKAQTVPAGDPGQALALHVAQIVKHIKAHKQDCPTAEREALRYIAQNRGPIRTEMGRMKAKQKTMTPDQAQQYEKRVLDLVAELVPAPKELMAAFRKSCPLADKHIADAMNRLEEQSQ